MKKTTALLLLSLFGGAAHAQTNTFPDSGNVGIGTTNPQSLLSFGMPIVGAVKTYTTEIQSGIDAYRVSAGNLGGYLDLYATRSGNGSNLGGSTIRFLTHSYSATIGVTERMRIDHDGNVGIGTTSPEAGTHLFQKDSGWPAVSGATQAFSILRLEPADSNGVFDFGMNAGSGAWLQATNRTDLSLCYPLLLNPNGGNVGIGTTSPTHKLSVNGTIRAKEVIVDTGWSDYVFADGYRLTPLVEVESQIKANRHLPGIPSAADIADHGVSLGDMQARLLAKVEELTLHQIAQEKRLTEQDTRIQRLEAENADLRMR